MNSKKILEFIEYRALFREAFAIEQQRQRNDRFYMAINLIIVTALAVIIFKPLSINPILICGLALIGILSCVRWWMNIRHHSKRYKTVEEKLLHMETWRPVKIQSALKQLYKNKGKDMREGMFLQSWIIGVFMLIQIGLIVLYVFRLY